MFEISLNICAVGVEVLLDLVVAEGEAAPHSFCVDAA